MPGATQEPFAKLEADAKASCLMSRLLNITVTMDAKLISMQVNRRDYGTRRASC